MVRLWCRGADYLRGVDKLSQDIYKLNVRPRKKKKPVWMTVERVCVQCGGNYLPIRQKQKYCSPGCREEFWAGNKRWLPDPVTVTEESLRDFISGYLRAVECLPDHGKLTIKY